MGWVLLSYYVDMMLFLGECVWCGIVIELNCYVFYDCIDFCFDFMLDQGVLEEVVVFKDCGFVFDLLVMKVLGVL